jgi:hypothetical protein
VRFSPDGTLLLWNGISVGMRSAHVPSHPAMPTDAPGLWRWVDAATSAAAASDALSPAMRIDQRCARRASSTKRPNGDDGIDIPAAARASSLARRNRRA